MCVPLRELTCSGVGRSSERRAQDQNSHFESPDLVDWFAKSVHAFQAGVQEFLNTAANETLLKYPQLNHTDGKPSMKLISHTSLVCISLAAVFSSQAQTKFDVGELVKSVAQVEESDLGDG